MRLADVEIPSDLGVCRRRAGGESPLDVVVVSTGPGHPADDEKAVYKVLEHLQGLVPIAWVFETFDGSQKSGHLYTDLREYDLKPYRAYSNKEVTRGIATMFVDSGIASAATGFGFTSEPAARLQPFDDWHAWARYRDALRRLNAEAGKIEGFYSLLEALLPADSSERADFQRLVGLLRLAWDYREWTTDGPRLKALDLTAMVAPLARAGLSPALPARALASWRAWACEFYEANLARFEALAQKALTVLRGSETSTAAIVVNVHWTERVVELLSGGGAGFLEVLPRNVLPASMLDHASLLLDELSGQRSRLGDLFSGKEIRERMQTMRDRPQENRTSWANDWTSAAQALYLNYQYGKAEECARRALEIDPRNAQAWGAKGNISFEQRRYAESVSAFERALALEPKNATYWDGLGAALDGGGKKRAARKALVRGLHLQPKNGALWCRLGIHLHGAGELRAACYCFERGEACGSPEAAQNRRTVCRSPASARDCPFELRPFWLAATRRLPWLVYLLAFRR